MFNSRIHLIVPYLERNPRFRMRIIGFDNLPANIIGLQKGIVSMLIAQHPELQVQEAISTLIEYIVFHRKPARQENHMHMDLLTRYNVVDY